MKITVTEPIHITKNGYEDKASMRIKLYTRPMKKGSVYQEIKNFEKQI